MNTSPNEQWLHLYNKQNSKSQQKNQSTSPDKLSTYFFIFDCAQNTILFINTAFEQITGHSAKEFDLDFLINMIHPEDQGYFFDKEDQGLTFTNQLKFNEHFRYTIKYSYRIKKADGTFIRIAQECQALEVNESGHLSKTLVTHKIYKTPPIEQGQNDYKIFDKLHSIYLDLNNSLNLTTRELEILTLIKEGLTSKEISVQLNISPNTILTHRKNILNKTKTTSFIELVKKLSCAEY